MPMHPRPIADTSSPPRPSARRSIRVSLSTPAAIPGGRPPQGRSDRDGRPVESREAEGAVLEERRLLLTKHADGDGLTELERFRVVRTPVHPRHCSTRPNVSGDLVQLATDRE